MSLNYILLFTGIILTVVSKVIQFHFHSKAGDFFVIPAAVCFVLAILFSIEKFKLLVVNKQYFDAVSISILASATVVSFQLMMIMLIGNKNKIGFIFLVPLLVSGILVVYKWRNLF